MAAGSWEATSSRPSMSRSASRRELVPLVEFLVLMLLTLRFILDRLFVDLKLRVPEVKGARTVDQVERRAALDEVEEVPKGYTGSTGAGELGTTSDTPAWAVLGESRGPSINSGLGKVVRLFRMAPSRLSISLRRSRRKKRMPRMRVMRIITDVVTEMAMTAGLKKMN